MSCLDGMNLSGPQQSAVFDERSPLLVAAGAGSGKTRLLVAYFVRALVDEGLAPEQLIAVTFTRKAAAELVSRIRSTLEMLGRPDLARKLDRATVGTIHGLCRRIIKERALEAGIDPAAGVLEAEAASLVKDRLSREAWEQVVQQAGERHLEVLAGAPEKLRKQIVPLYDTLRGMGHEWPQLTITVDAEGTEPRSPEFSLEPPAHELTDAIRAALVAAAECPRVTASLHKDLDRLERCLAWLQQPQPPAERAAAIVDTAAFFPSRMTSSMEVHFQPVRLALTRYRLALAESRLRPLVEVMNSLLAAFHDRYETHKLERGLLDFADLELRAKSLASVAVSEGRTVLPLGSRLLIDEFQDTNALQYGVLSDLGASRVVMVGDERQSIYRFRGADVGVFRARESELRTRDVDGTQGRLHRLDTNYRSRPEILAFFNTLFAQEAFFGGRFVALRTPDQDGGAARPLEAAVPVSRPPGAATAAQPAVAEGNSTPPAVEILVVQRQQECDQGVAAEPMQEFEAYEVATKVRGLIDDEGWSQRDIAILIPAQTHVELYQRALIAHGVDVYVVGGKGYYSQEEVADVIALLRLLVNPHDDLALVATLRSPLAGISDDGLYLLGREGRKTRASLWEVVRGGGGSSLREEDARRLRVFTERLLALRRRVGRPGLARLIDEAVSACDYDLCLLSIDQGKRRFANVRKMMRMASEFESLEGPDLAGFVALLGSMDSLSDREGSAPTLSEGEDVVRIMTVHQAKGLEFPVVVLAGLGSDVHNSDAADFMVSGDGRMGVFLRGSRRDTYEQQDLSWGPAAAILDDERAKEREEDIRLLYVAMTRAEKRLIVVGAGPRGGKLERCRIGRVLLALGFDTVPETAIEVPIEGLDAVVRFVTPSPSPQSEGVARARGSFAGALESASVRDAPQLCPQFLEVGAGDRGLQRISFSALADYLRCPRRHYLERVLRLEPQLDGRPAATSVPDEVADADDLAGPRPDEALLDEHERHSGREVGLAVHALLERLPAGGGRPSDCEIRQLVSAWQEETGSRLSEADLSRAIGLTLAFWHSAVAAVRDKPGATREASFLFSQSDTVVTGIMDLVLPGDDGWHIVDYKTNSLQGRSIEQVVAGYELQAVVYCLGALRCGASSVRIDFVFLEQPDVPVGFEYTAAATHELEKTLDDALEGLRRGRFAPVAGEQCSSCSVEQVCLRMAPGCADGIQ